MFNQTYFVLKKCSNLLTIVALLTSLLSNAQKLAENAEISFCQETLPLHQWKVAAQFEEALLHTSHLPLVAIRGNAPKFFRTIEPVLASYQIPTDFKYLCIVESALSSTALSAKGAFGFWQFMPETARAMGLTVNETIDERQNLMQSTVAACRYFRHLYSQLGSWTLVAAAYNVGPTKMKEYIQQNGRRGYYSWKTNPETRRYIYRIVAVKEMFNRAGVYRSVLNEKQSLYSFLKNQGTLLGLTLWPTINTDPDKPQLVANDASFLVSICESVASGFEQLLPLPYKRNGFGAKRERVGNLANTKSTKEGSTVNNNPNAPEFNSWWAALPFYNRRRDELYMIPPKVKLLPKNQILAA